VGRRWLARTAQTAKAKSKVWHEGSVTVTKSFLESVQRHHHLVWDPLFRLNSQLASVPTSMRPGLLVCHLHSCHIRLVRSRKVPTLLHHELAFKMKPSLVDSRLVQAGRRRGRSRLGRTMQTSRLSHSGGVEILLVPSSRYLHMLHCAGATYTLDAGR